MKKINLLLLFLSLILSTLSAQDREWNDVYDFKLTIINDSIPMNGYGSRTVYADNGDGIYHDMFINIDTIKSFLTGEILDYKYSKKIISLLDFDSSITKYDVEFKWICYSNNEIIDTATVIQSYYNSNDYNYSIKTEYVRFRNGNNYISWGEREPYNIIEDETRLSLPVMFKIKNVYTSDNYKDAIKNPDEIINYAEWTNDGFYRYSVTGEKDSLIFNSSAERENVLKWVEAISYNNTDGTFYLFSNFYYHEKPHFYVSTADMHPFPYSGTSKILKGQNYIWEKMNPYFELTTNIMKLKFIGQNLMFDSDYFLMRKKVFLLFDFIDDSDLRYTKKH